MPWLMQSPITALLWGAVALLTLQTTAGDGQTALLPSAWQRQHYTKTPVAHHAMCPSGSSAFDLLVSQLKDRWNDVFCTKGSCSKGQPCVHLTSFLQSLPGPELLHPFSGGG